MCVTDVYIERYADGQELERYKTSFCPYGRPCQARRYVYHEPRRVQAQSDIGVRLETNTPPRTPGTSPLPIPRPGSGSRRRSWLDGSPNRTTYIDTTTPPSDHRRRRSGIYLDDGQIMLEINSPSRRRPRSERIVYSDSPPTPRSPRTSQGEWPQSLRRAYTGWNTRTPSPRPTTRSPIITTGTPVRGRVSFEDRPVIINGGAPRASSVEAVVGERTSTSRRSASRRARSPSPRARYRTTDGRSTTTRTVISERERAHNDEILRRPRRPNLRPIISQSEQLQGMVENLDLNARTPLERYEQETAAYRNIVDADEEAMRERLRERQSPTYTYAFSGTRAGNPNARVITQNGVRRWA